MSHHGVSPTSSSMPSAANNAPLEPRPLELSLNPENGSLLTTPLTQVLLATTDALYQDLYNMAHGELDVVSTAAQTDAETLQQQTEEESALNPQQPATRRERMSNLSFAQRRHELAWRLAQHGRALQHVAGLTASDASSPLSQQVQVSNVALQHARTAWVQADEAQDAMYFFHAQLFPARAAPHDVYGALDVHLHGTWYDLPTDLRLAHDRYETTRLSHYTKREVDEQWQMAVRDKLLSGEVAWRRRRRNEQQQQQQPSSESNPQQQHSISSQFDLSLRGGILKLTHGAPRQVGGVASSSSSPSTASATTATSQEPSYPIQALLTIVSSSELDEWTLLSLDVRVEAKTGENSHQLEASNRQRYDLHRLAALAMTREEARVRRLKAAKVDAKDDLENGNEDELVARPLHALFQVAHTFSISWQLELLSAQAQALRRGAWSAGEGNQINVTPVQFLDHDDSHLLGSVSISFWRVDTSYGPPSMGDLTLEHPLSKQEQHTEIDSTTNQLVLSIRAEKSVGIKVALSGGESIRESAETAPHVKETIQNLLEAASNPFALSASDALLAATRLCTERKCDAAVRALMSNSGTADPFLPTWISIRSERGNISVAAEIGYHGVLNQQQEDNAKKNRPVLFRLACDARTGSFAPAFPRTMKLLRYLACNDVSASEGVALRIANTPSNRRRAAGAKSTGRLVKEAFDGLVRSMNVLGQRVGVGGSWDDKDDQSASIRDRSIASACRDVTISMTKCCGIATLFGLTPIAVGTALGVNASPDMAGEALETPVPGESNNSKKLFATPPLGVLLDQQLIETSKSTSDGLATKKSYLHQRILGFSFAYDKDGLTLYPLEIMVHLDSPASVPQRMSFHVFPFCAPSDESLAAIGEPPQKKRKAATGVENGGRLSSQDTHETIESVVPRLAAIVEAAVEGRKKE